MKGAALSIVALLGGTTVLHAAPPVVTPSRPIAGTRNCPYPDEARSNDEQGDVLVRFDVDADGRTTHVALVKSSGSALLDRAAIRCVATAWRNTPATRNGINVASPDHKALVHFQLNGLTIPKYVIRTVLALAGIIVLACVVFWRRERRP